MGAGQHLNKIRPLKWNHNNIAEHVQILVKSDSHMAKKVIEELSTTIHWK